MSNTPVRDPASPADAPMPSAGKQPLPDDAQGEQLPETAEFATKPANQLLVPTYVVKCELGRGGFGVVYLAYHHNLKRLVALKMLLAGNFASLKQQTRFLVEAETTARLKHPNIVQVYEVGVHADRPYLALEYVAGGSLSAKLLVQRMPPQAAAKLLATIADAVHAAHQQGIIHRDLKPCNILLEPDGTPKVSDFGYARCLDVEQRLTTSGMAVGTPQYMSPEQAEGRKEVGVAADTYALGAILYACLTGRPPFTGDSPLSILRKVVGTPPTAPSELVPDLPRDLEIICLKCLEKEPGRRYSSAADLAADLRRFLEDRPIVARPVTRPEQMWRWCRRNRAAAALCGVLGLVVLTLAIGGPIAAWHENELRAAEQTQRERAEANELRAKDGEAEANKQRDIAVTQRQRADRHSAISHAINSFVQLDLLRQADSQAQADLGFAAKKDVSVRELLDRASERIGERFRDQPEVEAAIRHMLGDTYRRIGQASLAVPHLQRSLTLYETATDRDENEVTRVLHSLAWAKLETGRSAEAVPLFEQALAAARTHMGPDDLETLAARNSLANAYRAAGRAADAVPLIEETLQAVEAKLGRDHADTLKVMHNLANVYFAAGQVDKSLPLLEETWQRSKDKLGPENPNTVQRMHDLAFVYLTKGKPAEATPLFEEALRLHKIQLAPDHPSTLVTMLNLGLAYKATGRLSEAVPLMEEALRGFKVKRGPEHPHTLLVMREVAAAYRDSGRLTEATELLRELLRLQEAKQPDGWMTFNTKSMLGGALVAQKKYPEAEPLLLQAYEGLQTRLSAIPRDKQTCLTECLERLVELYTAWEKPADAAKWREELAERRAGQTKGP